MSKKQVKAEVKEVEVKEVKAISSINDIELMLAGEEKSGGKKGSICNLFKAEVVASLVSDLNKITFKIGKYENLNLDQVKFIPVSEIQAFIKGNEKYQHEVDQVQKKFDKHKNVSWSLATMAGKQAGLFQETKTYKNGDKQIILISKELKK